ncbi:MAG: NfeD family protein [Actinomycetes bacterium]
MTAWIVWILAALVLGGIEVATLNLVFVMVAVGAVGGALTALVGGPMVAQAVVAAVVAVGMLAVVRPVALRHLQQRGTLRTGVAALVGARAVVLERVDAHGGRIKLAGEVWSARTYDPSAVVDQGAEVDVVSIEGATAVIMAADG